MSLGHTRPFMVCERNQRRAIFFAIFAGAICLYGILSDFAPLTGIGLGGLVVSLMFVFILALQIGALRPILDDMVTGNRFVHWVYSPEFWEAHLKRERRRKKLEVVGFFLIGLIPATLLGLLIGGLEYWSKEVPLSTSLIYGLLAILAMDSLFVIVGLFSDLYRWLRFRELKRLGGEVLIGETGLYYSGDLYKRHFNPRFLSVEWGEREALAHLLFKFEVRVKSNTYIEEVLIPIPPGREAEGKAALLQVQRSW